ncbi:MAG: Mur ligase family protein [Candidatus Omnitrophica bacterium]|nr:Mur ligase family protein [Candidatus Omnitrophota bacterium]
MEIKGKKVIVIGLGQSGLDAAEFAHRKGAHVFVTEAERAPLLEGRAQVLRKAGIEVELGGHRKGLFEKADWAVISPGISPQKEIFREASRALGDHLISEIELAYRFCPAQIIAITGTNGKSSVTSWTAAIFTKLGHPAVACGNLGNTFIGEISKLDASMKVVIEVSSFQLETIREFRPFIGVLLNITPDHFNWHTDWDDYVRAKTRLFMNQTNGDYAILNCKDRSSSLIAPKVSSKVLYFNCGEVFNPNWDAVLAITDIYGIDRRLAEAVLEKLPALPHRLEVVSTQDGLVYIDDSKATNPDSLTWALERQRKKVILLAGGRAKGTDFGFLKPLLEKKVKHLVLFGEARSEMKESWAGAAAMSVVETLEEAVDTARANANEGDIILLSPACASFDQFKSYKHRGDVFKAYAQKRSPLKVSRTAV